MTVCLRAAALLLALCGGPSIARAHAPQARGAAVSADGAKAAVLMPGFGILARAQASQPFRYVCDAVLDLQPTDRVAPLAFVSDGSLLVGSLNGVRILAPDSCPVASSAGELHSATVTALAADSGGTQTVYAAATAADKSGIWRSDDGGKVWQFQSALEGVEQVTALLIDAADPKLIYLSKGASLLRSTDRGLTFSTFEQGRALTLLHVPSSEGKSYWAMTRSLDNVTNRGFDIQRAATFAGPYATVQRVNYFGGFAIDSSGTIWVGDEGGGVYRSADGGDSFTNIAPGVATACLVSAGDGLWACTPGTNQQPALTKLDAVVASFAGVVSFADVKQQVTCGAEVDVDRRCERAWTEWQTDVLRDGLSLPDAGSLASADGGTPDASLRDAGAPPPTLDAGTAVPSRQDAGRDVDTNEPTPAPQAGCSVQPGAGAQSRSKQELSWLIPLLLLARFSRRRRALAW